MLIERSYSHGDDPVPKERQDAEGGDVRPTAHGTPRALPRAIRASGAIDAEAKAALADDRAERANEALVFPDREGGYLDDHNVRRRVWAPLL